MLIITVSASEVTAEHHAYGLEDSQDSWRNGINWTLA